jgi:hypothetical protein
MNFASGTRRRYDMIDEDDFMHYFNACSRQRARIKELETALQGMLDEWEKLSRYGSPMAKAANERVNAARRALCESHK